MEPNYPETLARLFIVNAPVIFRAARSIVKPLLQERTVDKVQIHGSNYSKALLDAIDESVLPHFLGGSLDWHPCTHEDHGHYTTA